MQRQEYKIFFPFCKFEPYNKHLTIGMRYICEN